MDQKEFRQKWVEALRSGEYKQTTGRLHGSSGYCCLGVACDLYVKYFPDAPLRITKFGSDIEYNDNGGTLPSVVRTALGITDEFGGFTVCDGEQTLTNLNDCGSTFEVIASIIESNPKGLFKNE